MKQQSGFSLIELLIAMLIGLGLLAGSLSIMTSNKASLQLNEALSSVQENGRFALTQLTAYVRSTGHYDPQAPELNVNGIDITEEKADLTENAVVFPGVYASNATLGSKNGSSNASDTLVIAMASDADCTQNDHGYGSVTVAGVTLDETYHVVNEFYLDDSQLKCRGYEGRVLRGDKSSSGPNSAATLVENVQDFQVLYGVALPDANGRFTGQPSSYVTANRAATAVAAGGRVVAIQISLLLFSEDTLATGQVHRKMKQLDTPAATPADKRVYRTFEQTILLRNSWNSAVFGGVS